MAADCDYKFLARTVDGDGYVPCRLPDNHDGKHIPDRDMVLVEDADELLRLVGDR